MEAKKCPDCDADRLACPDCGLLHAPDLVAGYRLAVEDLRVCMKSNPMTAEEHEAVFPFLAWLQNRAVQMEAGRG